MPTAVLIADDEEAHRARLLLALRTAWPGVDAVHECANGVDAWDMFLEFEPLVCFLDVRMPGMTGIDVAQRIGSRAAVVFVAAPGDHALAAFEAGAVDHVVKPIDPDRLAPVVARVQARLAAPVAAPADLSALLGQLASQVRRPAPLEVIEAGVGAEVRLVPVDDVVYLESDGRHTRIVLGDGGLLLRTPLKELLAQLDGKLFWQIHRSVVVNHRHIAGEVRVDEDNMVLTLRGRPERLPVSRPFQSLFRGQ